MTMHRELIAAKREPDLWLNVYEPDGPVIGSATSSREYSDAVAAPGRLYRLRIYLKPPQNPS